MSISSEGSKQAVTLEMASAMMGLPAPTAESEPTCTRRLMMCRGHGGVVWVVWVATSSWSKQQSMETPVSWERSLEWSSRAARPV